MDCLLLFILITCSKPKTHQNPQPPQTQWIITSVSITEMYEGETIGFSVWGCVLHMKKWKTDSNIKVSLIKSETVWVGLKVKETERFWKGMQESSGGKEWLFCSRSLLQYLRTKGKAEANMTLEAGSFSLRREIWWGEKHNKEKGHCVRKAASAIHIWVTPPNRSRADHFALDSSTN